MQYRKRRQYRHPTKNLGDVQFRNPETVKTSYVCPNCGSKAVNLGKGIVKCLKEMRLFKEGLIRGKGTVLKPKTNGNNTRKSYTKQDHSNEWDLIKSI